MHGVALLHIASNITELLRSLLRKNSTRPALSQVPSEPSISTQATKEITPPIKVSARRALQRLRKAAYTTSETVVLKLLVADSRLPCSKKTAYQISTSLAVTDETIFLCSIKARDKTRGTFSNAT